jgi:hypothetical protein
LPEAANSLDLDATVLHLGEKLIRAAQLAADPDTYALLDMGVGEKLIETRGTVDIGLWDSGYPAYLTNIVRIQSTKPLHFH